MSEEPKKRDAVADALAALAAGEHVEEAPLSGSGIAGQSDHVQLTPMPAPMPPPTPQAPPRPPAITAVPPAVGGGQPKVRVAAGKPGVPPAKPAVPSNTTGTRPAASSARTGSGGGVRPVGSGAPPAQPTPSPAARRPSNPAAPPTVPPATGRPPATGTVRPIAPAPGKRAAVPGAVEPARAAPVGPPQVRSATPIVNKRPAGPAAPVGPVARVAARPPVAPPAPADAFVVHDDTGSPSEHVPSAHELEVAAEAEAIAHVVEDDDTLNMPAPGPEAFAPRRPVARPKRELISRTVGFKQTLIPVLLSQGVLLSLIAIYLLVLGEDSPLVGFSWIPLSLLGIGVVLLVFWVITGLQVRSQLARAAAA